MSLDLAMSHCSEDEAKLTPLLDRFPLPIPERNDSAVAPQMSHHPAGVNTLLVRGVIRFRTEIPKRLVNNHFGIPKLSARGRAEFKLVDTAMQKHTPGRSMVTHA
jgi:hypothetical protein